MSSATEWMPATRLAIRRLERELPTNPGAIEEFFAHHTFPIVEGPTVTFVYRGEADRAGVAPDTRRDRLPQLREIPLVERLHDQPGVFQAGVLEAAGLHGH